MPFEQFVTYAMVFGCGMAAGWVGCFIWLIWRFTRNW